MNAALLRSFINEKIQRRIFSGATLLFGRPHQKLVEIFDGTISSAHSNGIDKSTLFDIQSITKSVATSAVCLKLIQDGKISLETEISKIYPDAKNIKGITLRHLLTHSSGLSDVVLEGSFKTPELLWKQMLSARPRFAPGSAIEYTDLGYRILGKFLEEIAGMNLQQASRELIWKPMGLKTMTYNPSDKMQTAATPDAHGQIDDEQVVFLGGVLGCDGVFSNGEDLFTFMSCLLSEDSIFNEKTKSMLLGTVTSVGSGPKNGFYESLAVGNKNAGWEINEAPYTYAGNFHSANTFEKAGGAGTFIWYDTVSKYIFVYLTNYGKPKPFNKANWERLLKDIGPHDVSNLIYENL
jgi:serine-type D-Ala-D-Ala carboxypeptidase